MNVPKRLNLSLTEEDKKYIESIGKDIGFDDVPTVIRFALRNYNRKEEKKPDPAYMNSDEYSAPDPMRAMIKNKAKINMANFQANSSVDPELLKVMQNTPSELIGALNGEEVDTDTVASERLAMFRKRFPAASELELSEMATREYNSEGHIIT